MEIWVYSKEDIKADGKSFKKKNNVKFFTEEDFLKYASDNKLIASYGYVDIRGTLSNNKLFRCYHNNIIVGVSDLCRRVNEVKV